MASPPRPETMHFTKEHEWVAFDQAGQAVIGISDYAAHELGDVVYVQLPEVGSAVGQFQKFGEIESVKAASDLFSPVSGEVTEVNTAIVDKPELVNESPFAGGWMLRLRLTHPDELNALMDQATYEAYLRDLERQALEGE